ncbi:GT-D fold domain-containing glycosyltransferase [Brachybacterium sp. AOP25-B2-12]|uniref:GT-D fold domain-containing glycosyltransferase n=1 Tax=Brachybacterium sp. AOP25-B2-12 TaxID=3457710 RepID=UPI0040343110
MGAPLRTRARELAKRLVGPRWRTVKNLAYHPRAVRSPMNPLYRAGLRIRGIDESIELLLASPRSLARYGDGELSIVMGIDGPRFQSIEPELTRRLRQVLADSRDDLLIGLPGALVDNTDLVDSERFFWGDLVRRDGTSMLAYVPTDRPYVDASLTRVYSPHRDVHRARRRFIRLQELWRDRDILFVEGEFTRSGVGNDLFDGARSIARIVCPAQDAFSWYEQIRDAMLEHGTDRLILCSLGPTATVLAHDAAVAGQQCVDLGHLDLEYMWAREDRGKILVPTRSVNELTADDDLTFDGPEAQEYAAQVLVRIPGA